MVEDAEVEAWRQRLEAQLWDSVIPFWLRHSLDREHGGYFNNLDRDGACFDDRKHVWLQARQVWMLARLCRAQGGDERLLTAATLGAGFLRRHARRDDGRVFFCLARDGRPVSLQRKIFSECFYALAMAEYGRVIPEGGDVWREEAMDALGTILELVRSPERLGRPQLSGQDPVSELAVPMILLNVVGELRDGGEAPDGHDFDGIQERCVAMIRRHMRPDRRLLHEVVGADGSLLLQHPEGRLINPGHAIEAGWFLLEHAQQSGDGTLRDEALWIIQGALEFGADREHGGLHYFLDSEGFSPTQLEWCQKLWWPHCEAMVATALAWQVTGERAWWERFTHWSDYTFAHFPDPEHGEWFGYLDRAGRVSQRFKGGPYKGCFHVPRALWRCAQVLGDGAGGV